MFRSILAVCVCFLFSLEATCVSATEYPWEKDAKEQKLKKQEPKPAQEKPRQSRPTVSNRPTFSLGPFVVDRLNGWKFEENTEGDTIVLRNGSGEVRSVIQVDNYSIQASNYGKAKKNFLRSFSYDVKKTINFAGRSDVLYLRDVGDGVTQVHIFPYSSDRIYRVYVFIKGEYKGVTRPVKNVLDTLRFAD